MVASYSSSSTHRQRTVLLCPPASMATPFTSSTAPTCHLLHHHTFSCAEQRHPPSPIPLTLVAIWPPSTASHHLGPRCTCFCSTDSSTTGAFRRLLLPALTRWMRFSGWTLSTWWTKPSSRVDLPTTGRPPLTPLVPLLPLLRPPLPLHFL